MTSEVSNKRKVVYLAGPIRGYKNWNKEAFEIAAKKAKLLGFEVLSPMDFEQDSPYKNEVLNWSKIPLDRQKEICHYYVEQDVKLILLCTHIAMLDGWENSVGATAEYNLAKWLLLDILNANNFESLNINYQ